MAAKVDQLSRWLELVEEWNSSIDLTAARTKDELVDLFIVDAAIVAKHACEANASWVDVGSGAGAPGIGVHLLLGTPMTLVEPKTKRVAFLRTVVGELDLQDVEIRRARCGDLESDGWTTAISRATLNPDEWMLEGSRLARQRFWLLLARQDAPAHPSWLVDSVVEYQLPCTGAERRAVCYRKQ